MELERGKLERAYHLFDRAIQLTPEAVKFPEPHYYQAVVLQRWQQYDRAHEAYAKAYELAPDDPAYLLAVAEMLVQLDRPADATEMLEAKVAYFDQNAGVRAALGHLYMMQKRPADAAASFEQASLLSPEDLKLQEELALAYAAAGEHGKAAEVLQTLLRRRDLENRHDLRRTLAAMQLKSGNDLDARTTYSELTQRDGAEPADWLALGQIAFRVGDNGAALAAAGRAIRLAPERPEGYLLAGLVWQRRGHLDNALQAFDRAAAVGDSADGLILRGLALQRANKNAAAADAYTAALKRQPGDERALRLLQQVATAE